MKWLVAALIALCIAGIAGVVLVRAIGPSGPVYSVSQLDALLRRNPAAVVDHVVSVRGVVGFCPVSIGCAPNIPPILGENLGPLGADPPLQLDYGPGDPLLATVRGFPLVGGLVPARAPLTDGYQGVLRVRIEPVSLGDCFERLCYEGVLMDKARP